MSAAFFIDKFSKNGRGIGSQNGHEIEVIGSVPGDTVEIGKRFRKKKRWMADLLNIVKPSSVRIPPQCSHFPTCGGCTFQTLPYADQLKWKQSFVEDLFMSKVDPILGMDMPWFYRNKMEYTFRNGSLGLIAAGTKGKVLDLSDCVLTPPWFMEVLARVREWWKKSNLSCYSDFKNCGTLRTLTLREGRRTGDRMIILSVSGNADDALGKQDLASFVECVGKASIFLETVHVKPGMQTQRCEMHLSGPHSIREKLSNLEFSISPSSFFQPNTVMAEKMFEVAKERIGKHKRAYDLFCGMGTIGMIMADQMESVLGVELNPYAVCDAETNLEINGIENVKVEKGDVKDLAVEGADIIFLDPPRSGLTPKMRERVIAVDASTILYIACNPKTQKEDVQVFSDSGFRVDWIQPVDQFPHTPHIENICLLKKS